MPYKSSDSGIYHATCAHCDTDLKPASVVGWNRLDVDNAPPTLPRVYHCGNVVDGLVDNKIDRGDGCGANFEITPESARERNIAIDPRVRQGRADPGTLPPTQAAGRSYSFPTDAYQRGWDNIDWSKGRKND